MEIDVVKENTFRHCVLHLHIFAEKKSEHSLLYFAIV